MKVIFLDFDGVINNFSNDALVDENNVRVLREIIKLSGAGVVVTSSNKYTIQCNKYAVYSDTIFAKYINLLYKYGVSVMEVTPFVQGNRSLEIKEYLDIHEVSEYVILDDDIIGDEFINHQVYLDLQRGLLEEHIKPAIDILNGKLGFYPKDYDRSESNEKRLIRANLYHNK